MWKSKVNTVDGKFIVTQEFIKELTTEERVAKGWDYFIHNRVTDLQIDSERMSALVRGSKQYSVTIMQLNDGTIDMYCTCPYVWGSACKHIVAVLFAVMKQQTDEGLALTLPQDTLKMESDAQPVSGSVKSDTKQHKWTKKIEHLLLSNHDGQNLQIQQVNWKLIYLIHNGQYTTQLLACRQKLRKDGSVSDVSRITNYDLNDSEHFDAVDKLIIPYIATPQGLELWKNGSGTYTSNRNYRATPPQLFSTILHHLEEKEVYYTEEYEPLLERITVRAKPVELSFIFQEDEKGDSLECMLHTEGGDEALQFPLKIIMTNPLWILSNKSIYSIDNADDKTLLYLQKASGKLHIPEEFKEQFRKQTLPRLLERFLIKSENIAINKLQDGFSKRIYLEERESNLHIFLRFAYSNYEAPRDHFGLNFIVASDDLKTYYSIERNFQAETDARRELLDSYVSEVALNEFTPRQQSLDWVMQKLPLLIQNGFEVFGKEKLKSFRVRTLPTMSVSISSGIDWFDLSMNIDYDGIIASFKDVYASIQKDEQFVKLNDGTLGLIPAEWMKKFKRAFTLTDAKGSEWKLSKGHFSLIDQLFHDREITFFDKAYEEYKERFKNFSSIGTYQLPGTFKGVLRPYQQAGYDWLQFLKEFQFNGCLADDMGLGKTVQALALLQHEYCNGATGPSLIIVPTSIVFNWINEAQRFTPELKILCQTGNKRAKATDALHDYNVIITSYGTLRRDIKILQEMQFHYIILDESQNIKNPGSQNAKAVKLLKARHRLSLTGTPVENNLLELWSQFDFLNPGLLGSRNGFNEQFVRPIEKNKDADAVEMLKKTIFPFILRRTKDVVAKELPPKTETVKFCEMEKPQRTIYNQWRDYYRAAILDSIETVGLQNSKFKVLEGLMKLRQICCHPHLVDNAYSGTSGKYEVWKEMVGELLSENHKTLIFSQFVKMLRILSEHCDTLEVDYEYLDGQTRDREERVKRFQENEDVRLFLISLKAGGTGLNLTAADYVIHYDPWWNPAVEMQATDRTHRIGQTKNIFSYKLITRDTIEEKILQLQEKKRELVQSIITAEAGIMKQITKEDIEMLFE